MQASRRRIGRHRIGQIACGCTRHGLESEFDRSAQSDTDHAILEGECRIIDCVVLNPQFANPQTGRETIGLNQRGVAHLGTNGRFAGDREKFPVAPHVLRAGADFLAGQALANALVVVGHLQRAEIKLAHMGRAQWIFPTALTALQCLHESVALAHKQILPLGPPTSAHPKTSTAGQQKAPSAKREGVSNGADASHLRRNLAVSTGFGTWA